MNNLPTYNETDQSTLKPGLYLALFHGRDDPDQYLDDWGFNGPMIGPLKYAHTTYGNEIKVRFESHEDWLTYYPNEPRISGYRLLPGMPLNSGPEDIQDAEGHHAVEEVFYQSESAIDIVGGEMVLFQGKYYGDWTVFNVKGEQA